MLYFREKAVEMVNPGREDRLLNAREVSEILNISIMSVWRMFRKGEVPTVIVGERSRRVKRSDLDAYINSRYQDLEPKIKGMGG